LRLRLWKTAVSRRRATATLAVCLPQRGKAFVDPIPAIAETASDCRCLRHGGLKKRRTSFGIRSARRDGCTLPHTRGQTGQIAVGFWRVKPLDFANLSHNCMGDRFAHPRHGSEQAHSLLLLRTELNGRLGLGGCNLFIEIVIHPRWFPSTFLAAGRSWGHSSYSKISLPLTPNRSVSGAPRLSIANKARMRFLARDRAQTS